MGKKKKLDKELENMADMMDEGYFEQMMAEMQAERMKAFKKRRVPESRTLVNSLQTLTKNEIEDINYNLNLSVNTTGTKAKTAAEMAPYIQEFIKGWLTSSVEDQIALYDHFVEHEGITDGINNEDARLDYLMGIGVINCGVKDDDKDKLYWYMPDEILEIYKAMKSDTYTDMVRMNDEIMRLSAGLVHYYGAIDYDSLFKKIKEYTENDELEFAAFMQIMLNGGMWYNNVQGSPQCLFMGGVIEPDTLLKEQRNCDFEFAEIPYDKAYEAGDPNYIESTPEFRAMAQYLMSEFKLDLMESAGIMNNIFYMVQNMVPLDQSIQYIVEETFNKGINHSDEAMQKLNELLNAYNETLPSWRLRGHTVQELKEKKAAKKAEKKAAKQAKHGKVVDLESYRKNN